MAMRWGRTDCTGLTDWRSLGLFFLDREAAKSSVRRSSWRRHCVRGSWVVAQLMGPIMMTWPVLKYCVIVISVLLWVDILLGKETFTIGPNTSFWGKTF